jgi:Flp pilus assembly protein TadB
LGAAFLAGLISGFATYFLLKRKHEAQLTELSSLITEMKKIEEKANGGGGEGITETALSLADKIVTLLPEIVRKRDQDSLLFGVAAFVVALFGGNFAVAILVGVIVWLYFRYEFRKTYEQEISKFEEQKRVFEQRKTDFIETL